MATTRRTFLQAAAGLGLAPWPAHAQALTKVRYVSSSPVARPYHAYIYAGARAGLHTKIGVDPEFLFIAGSGAVLQLLISGDGDIGNIGILEFIATKKKQPTLPLSVVYCHDYQLVLRDGRSRRQSDHVSGRPEGKIGRRDEPRLRHRADDEGDGAPGRHRSRVNSISRRRPRGAGDGCAEIRSHRRVSLISSA